jgi:hypothetical protein
MDRRPKIRHHAAKFDGKKSLQNVHVLQRMPTTSGMRLVFKKGRRFYSVTEKLFKLLFNRISQTMENT